MAQENDRPDALTAARRELADLGQRHAAATAKLEVMGRTVEDLRLHNCRLDAQYTEARIALAVAEARTAAAREAAARAEASRCCGCGCTPSVMCFSGNAACHCQAAAPTATAAPTASASTPPAGSAAGSPTPSQPTPTAPTTEATLQYAKMTFTLPEGDDKDDDTAVSVMVSTRINDQFDSTIAELDRFGEQQVWEDDGSHAYSYNLVVMPGIKRNDVVSGGVTTTIAWAPVGDDRCFFNYMLVLGFSDGSEISQSSPAVIEMSQDIRTYTNP